MSSKFSSNIQTKTQILTKEVKKLLQQQKQAIYRQVFILVSLNNKIVIANIIKMQDQKQDQACAKIAQSQDQKQNFGQKVLKQGLPPVKTKFKLILKKKQNKVPYILNYSYVFKISESLIINQKALKQPQVCSQSFMANVFYFKTIRSISITQNYVSLSLKETQHNQFPLQYYVQRFKSFGDQQFYQLAKNLQLLDAQLGNMAKKCQLLTQQQQQRNILRSQLQEVLSLKKGKRYLCFYSQPTGNHVTMNRMVISTGLLTQLGYDVRQICIEFLKYRHVFFEIFDTSFYYQIVKKAGQRLNQANNSEKQKVEGSKQSINTSSLNSQKFNDYIFRTKHNEQGSFQQKLKAQIQFSKPYPNISFYQITNIDESNIVENKPKKNVKYSQKLKDLQRSIVQSEMKSLQNLNYSKFQQFKINYDNSNILEGTS